MLAEKANNGTLSSEATKEYNIEDSFNLYSDTDISRTGYTLVGWTISSDGTDATNNWATAGETVDGVRVDYKKGAPISGKYGDVTLVAQWKANTYTITYDANEGEFTSAGDSTQTYTYPSAVTLRNGTNITRAGYTLIGFTITDDDGNWTETYPLENGLNIALENNAFTTKANMRGDVTLVAQWEANKTPFDVIVNIQNTSGSYTQLATFSVSTYDTGTTVEIEDIKARVEGGEANVDGFKYASYSTNKTGNSLVVAGDGSLEITLNYNYIVYTATVNAGDGQFAGGGKSQTYYYNVYGRVDYSGEVVSNQKIGFALPSRADISRTGYTLTKFTATCSDGTADGSKWLQANTDLGQGVTVSSDADNASSTARLFGNITLTAEWSVNSYTIQYNQNYGTGNAGIRGLNYAVRSADWNTTQKGVTIDYDAGTNVFTLDGTSTGNITLVDFAGTFEAGTYKVGYYVLDGAMNMFGCSFRISLGSTVADFPNDNDYFASKEITISSATSATITISGIGASFSNTQIAFFVYKSDEVMLEQEITYGIAEPMSYAEREGYAFAGWNTDADGEGTYYSYENIGTITDDIELFAQWKPMNYVINFDAENYVPYPYLVQPFNSTDTTENISFTEEHTIVGNELVTKITIVNPGEGYTGWWLEGYGLEEGVEYVWTVDIKSTHVHSIHIGKDEGGAVNRAIEQANTWQTFKYKFLATNDEFDNFQFYAQSSAWSTGEVFEFKNVSVQKVSDIRADHAIGNRTVRFGELYGTLPTPTKTGYKFEGWYLDDEAFENKVESATTVGTAQNHTLYSKWTANEYQVEFAKNAPDDAEVSGVMENQTFTYDGGKVALRKNTYVNPGYTFRGWGTAESIKAENIAARVVYPDEALVENLTTTTDTVTLYAVWEANTVTVTFNLNDKTDGNGSTEATFLLGDLNSNGGIMKVAYSGTFNDLYVSDENTRQGLMGADRAGYTFDGWFTDKTNGVQVTKDTKVNAIDTNATLAITLYARWTPETLTVTYNGNGGMAGGEATVSGTSATFDATYTILPNEGGTEFVRAGYSFAGWSLGSGDNNEILYSVEELGENGKEITFQYTSNLTLYAVWEAHTYTLVLDANDANTPGSTATLIAGKDDEISLKYNESYTFESIFSKKGYTFVGWATDAETTAGDFTGDGAGLGDGMIKNGEKVSGLTTVDNGTYTLYAIWQADAVAYKVNFRVQSVASARAGSTDLATAFVNFTADTISTTAYAGTEVTIETLMNAFESKYGVYKLAEHDIVSSAGEGNYIVQGDGSLVIDVYYTRGTYDVTITIGTGIASVTVKGASSTVINPTGGVYKVYYDETITLSATAKAGYANPVFKDGEATVSSVQIKTNKTFTVSATPQTVTYNVEIYQQNIADDNYVKFGDTKTASGLTDTNVAFGTTTSGFGVTLNGTPFEYNGFEYNEEATTANNEGGISAININGDKSTTVKIYFDRRVFEVEIVTDAGVEDVTGAGTYKYGATFDVTVTLKDGYSFGKWTASGTTLTNFKPNSQNQTGLVVGVGDSTLTITTTLNSYNLTINPNGGTYDGETANTVINEEYTTEVALLTPVRRGYTFAGWEQSGSGTGTLDGSVQSGFTFTMGVGDNTLTAKWNENSYSIKFTNVYNSFEITIASADGSNPRKVTIPANGTDGSHEYTLTT